MKLHYSQTYQYSSGTSLPFEFPMKLHYSQTESWVSSVSMKFEFPMKLHYSQTSLKYKSEELQFEFPMKLHYSQTSNSAIPFWSKSEKTAYELRINGFSARERNSNLACIKYTTLNQINQHKISHKSSSMISLFSFFSFSISLHLEFISSKSE